MNENVKIHYRMLIVITTEDLEVKHKARGTFAYYFIYLQMTSFSR